MNRQKYNIDEKTKELIISAAYDDLNFFEKRKAEKIINENPEAEKLFNEYKQTAEAVHSLSRKKYSGSYNQTKENVSEVKNKLSLFELLDIYVSRPVIAAVSVLVVAAGMFYFIEKNESENMYGQYTKQEVEQAEMEIKQSLAIVGKTLKKTENILTNEILEEQVSQPVIKSFYIINDLFIGG